MNTAIPASGTVRRRAKITFTVRGGALLAVAVLSLVLAYLMGWDELLIVACFAALPPVLAFTYVRAQRPRISVSRVVTPSTLHVRASATVRVAVRNDAARGTVHARWRDRLPWAPGATPPESLSALPPHSSAAVRYELVPPRRGVVEFGPMLVELTDPFRLVRGTFETLGRQRVVVAPESSVLDAGAVDIAADSGSARLFQHRAMAGEHDLMTREYRPGDALRRVHWRASAHHGELMVREDEKRSHAEAVIVLETRRSGYPDSRGHRGQDRPESESFEWALRMTASLRDHLIGSGLSLRIMETTVPQLADADRADDFVESLARITLSFQDARALRAESSGDDGLGSLFAILGTPDAEVLDALVDLRPLFDFAGVFLVLGGGGASAAEAALRAAGFRVVVVEPADPVALAWARMGADDAVA